MANTKTRTRSKKSKRKPPRTASVRSKRAFKRYDEAMRYLLGMTDYEKEKHLRYNVDTFNLKRMHKLLSLLGNPHKKVTAVHIAGTKGKGSTAFMLAKMLEANGYRVGLYTSPHLVDLHERIMVNSRKITKDAMYKLLNRLYAPIEKMAKSDPPTFFEIMTAAALLHFVDQQTDIAVIETGLGGRLDSTNVIKPKVVGITSLSIDHHLQLGATIDKIATEKAGIFKKGVPIVTVQQEPAAMKVLRTHAATVEAPFSVTGGDIDFSHRFETSPEHGPHNRICLTTSTSKFEHLRVPLHGIHQAINCGLALAMLDKLKGDGFEIDNDKAVKGLHQVEVPGRMEMICQDPRILIDAAHNAASIRALVHATGQNIAYDSMIVIFGCNQDKDVKGMLHELQYGADKVIFTRSNSGKAVSPDELAEMYYGITGRMCQSATSLSEALRLAASAVGKEDLICITGSFYLIGQAKSRFNSR